MSTQNNKVLLQYLRSSLADGAITIVYTKPTRTKPANVGVAFCSPHDMFSRATGRTLATNRLHAGDTRHSYKLHPSSYRHVEVVTDTLTRILVSGQHPAWATKLLKQLTYDTLQQDIFNPTDQGVA